MIMLAVIWLPSGAGAGSRSSAIFCEAFLEENGLWEEDGLKDNDERCK